ncbi:hypothetical protein BU26DRAFT_517821 [Trematosphaeria pertusa]|uniref:Uncharacterized protein n=1 Tax=Trematosphaeria pertusa TaxID=390896 RepID=A0A6A6INN3_9PLEO|nr:uncharacterized protein BU26DRAFT_517821 [Trematosphaeria pertusa]KAF2251093.1 hypothetical protein BU26DRAFT_517821 [Trematosphaeria pertusa]
MSKSYCISLPAELRNEIYRLCTPVTAHIDQFSGLLLASKQTKDEYEKEAVKSMRGLLEGIQRQWPHRAQSEGLQLSMLSRFRELASITVSLPLTLYYSRRTDPIHGRAVHTRLETCLAPLFSLRLSRLTITFYENEAGFLNNCWVDPPQGLLYDLTNILVTEPTRIPQDGDHYDRMRREFHLSQPLRVRRLVFEWVNNEEWDIALKCLVKSCHSGWFLNKGWWWQGPEAKTLVTNWGGDGSSTGVEFHIDTM